MYSFKIKSIYFLLISWIFLIGTAVYLTPLNEFGEFHLPPQIILIQDTFAFIVAIFILLQSLKTYIKFDMIEIFTIIFLLSSLVFSIFHLSTWSINEYLHYYMRNIFYYFVIGLIIYHYGKTISTEKWDYYFQLIFWLITIISFLLIFLAIISDNAEYYLWEGKRLCGTMINHNSFGATMVFFLYWSYYKFKKLINKYTIISALLILMTGSLTSYLGALLILIKRPILLLLLLIIITTAWVLFQDEMLKFSSINKIYEILTNDNTHLTSLSARIEQFYWVIDNIFENSSTFIFGVQSNTFLRFDSQYYQIISNFGIVVLILFLFQGIISYLNVSKGSSKLYILWLFTIALFLTSFLTRWNIIILYFVSLAYGVSKNMKSDTTKDTDKVLGEKK